MTIKLFVHKVGLKKKSEVRFQICYGNDLKEAPVALRQEPEQLLTAIVSSFDIKVTFYFQF